MTRPRFAGVELTPDAIAKCRDWFIANARASIAEAVSGRTYVNDLADYIAWREGHIAEWEAMDLETGKGDCPGGFSFAFLQRAHFIQTGESVPLLPR